MASSPTTSRVTTRIGFLTHEPSALDSELAALKDCHSFLQGVLVVLRDSGHPGLMLILDEVETIQRVRSDVRDKSLNALRQLIDEVDAGRFPGLYLVITGTSRSYPSVG